ncbi:membrane protein [Pseudonocardia sulfidoxydans NBRC 16205]|uniref:Membrane protein n=1 Tax=Pseudonocardia sulfidoxydans NBRC 16205 TaxID=1223511 RepID=A0A511DBM6_9PSEU|nr:potassium channel family protein [Pseudonocardia sulfidoxydans]GEL22201.1 membrane protein [Pseudonocardia sulfidoxydans NBRC 16205]
MTRRDIVRTLVSAGLVVIAYYVAPFGENVMTGDAWLRGGLLAIVLALLVLVVGRRVDQELQTPNPARAGPLLVALVAGVVTFALADLVVATTMPGQFVDLRTKTDALYFSLTTLTTVGYGDVHAEGQVARGLVVAQLVFDVAVLATAARALVGTARGARVSGGGRVGAAPATVRGPGPWHRSRP